MEVPEDLIAFIMDRVGCRREECKWTASIEDDLETTGDDAIELIMAYHERYGVRIGHLDLSEYFHPEPHSFSLLEALFRSRSVLKPISVGDLAQGLHSGVLLPPRR